jgi:hypothetical protein
MRDAMAKPPSLEKALEDIRTWLIQIASTASPERSVFLIIQNRPTVIIQN